MLRYAAWPDLEFWEHLRAFEINKTRASESLEYRWRGSELICGLVRVQRASASLRYRWRVSELICGLVRVQRASASLEYRWRGLELFCGLVRIQRASLSLIDIDGAVQNWYAACFKEHRQAWNIYGGVLIWYATGYEAHRASVSFGYWSRGSDKCLVHFPVI